MLVISIAIITVKFYLHNTGIINLITTSNIHPKNLLYLAINHLINAGFCLNLGLYFGQNLYLNKPTAIFRLIQNFTYFNSNLSYFQNHSNCFQYC